jgi:hypothetical protein
MEAEAKVGLKPRVNEECWIGFVEGKLKVGWGMVVEDQGVAGAVVGTGRHGAASRGKGMGGMGDRVVIGASSLQLRHSRRPALHLPTNCGDLQCVNIIV